jgi:hypothetical protein
VVKSFLYIIGFRYCALMQSGPEHEIPILDAAGHRSIMPQNS